MMDFVKELIHFISDLASGEMNILAARKKAAELQKKAPEHLTDELLAEVEAQLAELKKGKVD
jgi:hypothetical protein